MSLSARAPSHLAPDLGDHVRWAVETLDGWEFPRLALRACSRRRFTVSVFGANAPSLSANAFHLRQLGLAGFGVDLNVYRSGEDDEQFLDLVEVATAQGANPFLVIVRSRPPAARGKRNREATHELIERQIAEALHSKARHIVLRTARSQVGVGLPADGLRRVAKRGSLTICVVSTKVLGPPSW